LTSTLGSVRVPLLANGQGEGADASPDGRAAPGGKGGCSLSLTLFSSSWNRAARSCRPARTSFSTIPAYSVDRGDQSFQPDLSILINGD
jgi:hypothetical protein